MTRYLRENFYQPPSLQLWNPAIPEDVGLGKALPEIPQIFPVPSNKTNPFGPPPKIQGPQKPPRSEPNTMPVLPAWPYLPLPSSPGNNNPFGDPPKISPQQERPPHEVDPPGQNPYNDPDYRPFRVTENLLAKAGDGSPGGLLGRLLALHAEQTRIAADAYGNDGPNDARGGPMYATPPQEFPDAAQKPVRVLARRIIR